MATEPLASVLHYLRKTTTPVAASDVSDAELLRRFSHRRDEAAFTALVRRHGPMVLAVCHRVLRDEHTAEDAFQATFLVLSRKAASLTRPELLGHWLHGVAYRTATKAKSESAKRRAREQKAIRSHEIHDDDELSRQELRAVLDEEVNRLPERYRLPVVLCYLQGHTNAEAARRLGCSRGTIATLLARTRAKLRRRLSQRGMGLSAGIVLTALTQGVRASVVSFSLERVTVKAASLLAAGQSQAAGALAAQAIALAKGVGKAMLIEKLKIPAAILMMTALVGTGAGVTIYRVRAQGTDKTATAETVSKSQPTPKVKQPRKHVTAPVEPQKGDKIEFRTANFAVTAATKELAQRIGEAAEHNRKALAQLWLHKELPAWTKPCSLRVKIADSPGCGATTFAFQDGEVLSRAMVLEGSLDVIFADHLPHEITHTILADWHGRPIPRWADEGAATLSESVAGRARYERGMAKVVREERLLQLRDLLPIRDFPKDLLAFYAQSLSLTDFLVSSGGRKKFLAFVEQGERDGWDKAAQSGYGYKTVEDLERAWLEHVRKRLADKPPSPPSQIALPSAEGRKAKPRPAPRPGEALPASFKKQLPAGPAPVHALVLLEKDGRLSVSRKNTIAEPVTEVVTLKNGQKHQVTYYERKEYDFAVVYDFAAVRVHDTKGRAVDAKELRKRLKGETLVLVSANGCPVDPQHLRLYKEDTLVFVLPPQTLRAEPGRDPIAPPAPAFTPVPPQNRVSPIKP